MLALILGFVAPFLPDLLGMGKSLIDHKHEMDMLKLRHDQAKQEFTWRIEEIHTKADIEEMMAVRKPHKSYGVKMLDRAADAQGIVWPWVFNGVLIAFSVLDWVISFVRPGITYWVFGLYGAMKISIAVSLYSMSGDVTEVFQNPIMFDEFDKEMMKVIFAFWFGDRTRRRAVGTA